MAGVKITYGVDNKQWSDAQFEDEPQREYLVTLEMLKDLIPLREGEFISDIEEIKIIRGL